MTSSSPTPATLPLDTTVTNPARNPTGHVTIDYAIHWHVSDIITLSYSFEDLYAEYKVGTFGSNLSIRELADFLGAGEDEAVNDSVLYAIHRMMETRINTTFDRWYIFKEEVTDDGGDPVPLSGPLVYACFLANLAPYEVAMDEKNAVMNKTWTAVATFRANERAHVRSKVPHADPSNPGRKPQEVRDLYETLNVMLMVAASRIPKPLTEILIGWVVQKGITLDQAGYPYFSTLQWFVTQANVIRGPYSTTPYCLMTLVEQAPIVAAMWPYILTTLVCGRGVLGPNTIGDALAATILDQMRVSMRRQRKAMGVAYEPISSHFFVPRGLPAEMKDLSAFTYEALKRLVDMKYYATLDVTLSLIMFEEVRHKIKMPARNVLRGREGDVDSPAMAKIKREDRVAWAILDYWIGRAR